jgi:hypothetical protein
LDDQTIALNVTLIILCVFIVLEAAFLPFKNHSMFLFSIT